MSKRKIIAGTGVGITILVLAVVLCLLVPYSRAENTMPSGNLELAMEEGELQLSWPAADSTDYYLVQIYETDQADTAKAAPFREIKETGTSCNLTGLPTDRPMTIQVSSAKTYRIFGKEHVRRGTENLHGTMVLGTPTATAILGQTDPDTDILSLTWQMAQGDTCRIFRADEDGTLTEICSTEEQKTSFRFGPDGDLPELQYGENCRLVFEVLRQAPGIIFRGGIAGEVSLTREDFLGRDLQLTCTPMGHNRVHLQWQETKGEKYLVQELTPDQNDWQTVAEISRTDERFYESGHLRPFEKYSFRVVATGGQVEEGSEFAARSPALEYVPEASILYTTIWPSRELDIFRSADCKEVIGKAPVGKAFCVLGEENGMFAVRTGEELGYIDSNYCLINLPEYLGKLCSYNITNSYSSIYLVHEYEIPRVSGRVITGYEHVRQEDGSYLVPLLYPAAQKLLNAGKIAVDRGYRIRIYDSFRPYKATRAIYDITKDIVDNPIPEKTFTGRSVTDLPEPKEGEKLTYQDVMTSPQFGLSFFLAKSRSQHNRGLAMDLTIEDYYSGEEIRMQTSIHDLSHYSAVRENNGNANALKSIMETAGFSGLVSEWWHFQDNDAGKTLDPPWVQEGLSAECWVRDDFGWRYRTENGNFLNSCTEEIDGMAHTFDSDGYTNGPENGI